MEGKTQKERVLSILKRRTKSWTSSMIGYDMEPRITRLTARIWDLKQDGYEIEDRFVRGKNWKEYRLITKKK